MQTKHDVISSVRPSGLPNETPLKSIIYAVMNAITTNITSHKCQCAAPFVIICPIAIAYSMGQIIKSVCVCQCVSVSVCPSASTLTIAFLDRFSLKLAQT